LSLKRLPIFGIVALMGLGYWGWDATHHDHGGAHGSPLTVAQIQRDMVGEFQSDDGTTSYIRAATCRPGEDGKGTAPATHFRCTVVFGNQSTDSLVIHVLPDSLMFKTAEG
jgi:hypothetical protein